MGAVNGGYLPPPQSPKSGVEEPNPEYIREALSCAVQPVYILRALNTPVWTCLEHFSKCKLKEREG